MTRSGVVLGIEVVVGATITLLAVFILWAVRTMRKGVVADLVNEVRQANATIREVNQAVNHVQPGDPTLYELTAETRRLTAEQTALAAEQRALTVTVNEKMGTIVIRMDGHENRIEQLGGYVHSLYRALEPQLGSDPPWDGATDQRRRPA